jgi:membrane-associated phospholipid phosphatase
MEPSASGGDPDRFRNLPSLFWADGGQIVRAPARWDRSDWLWAGAGAAGILGTALLLDQPAERFMRDHASRSWDREARAIQNLGSTPSVVMAIGIYAGGAVFKDPEVRATGVDAMVAMALSQALFVLPLKELVGRSRPSANQGAHDFHPLSGAMSFPSGHATQAFMLASVLAEHADRPWVSGLSYGLAGLVGLARVEQRQHFLSDVVAGGLFGTFVGKTVVRYNQSLRAGAGAKISLAFAPAFQPGGCGIWLALKF